MSSRRPRILIVSRLEYRNTRPFDFVHESHLEYIQRAGGLPVVIPRTAETIDMLEDYLPMDGLILVEGKDVQDKYNMDGWSHHTDIHVDPDMLAKHTLNVTYDSSKDKLEWALIRCALRAHVPIFAICRGMQILNLATGGTLYYDIETQVSFNLLFLDELAQIPNAMPHVSYKDYDNLFHAVRVVEDTPICSYYKKYIDSNNILVTNSYHHQAVRKVPSRFKAMAICTDGIIEGFYDPSVYDPKNGKFLLGFQDCAMHAYNEFVEAAKVFATKRVEEKVEQFIDNSSEPYTEDC